MEFQMSWYPTTDMSLLVRNLRSSWRIAQFVKDYDIKHTTSSPYHPQANGQAERTVQTVKRLLVKAKDPCKALLDYRNSPLDTGFSPAQLFLGRRLKTTLPTTSKLLQPGHGSSKERHSEMVSRRQKQKFYFDKKASGNLSTFPAGDPVMMKFRDTWKTAEVVTPHSTPRSYVFCRDERKQYRRTGRCWGLQWLPQETVICQWLFHHRVKQNVWLTKQVVRLHHTQMTTAKWSEKKMWWKPDQAELSKFQLGFVMMTHKVYQMYAHRLWPVV